MQLVKKGFNQRRKTLRNALKEFLRPDMIQTDLLNKRAEQLSVDDFVVLANLIKQH